MTIASETSLRLATLMGEDGVFGREGFYVQSVGSDGGDDVDGAGGSSGLPCWEWGGGAGAGGGRGEGDGFGEADGGGGGGMLLGNSGGISACEGRGDRDFGIRGRFG